MKCLTEPLFFDTIKTMEKHIKKLKKKLGTYRAVALHLDITERRLMQIAKGDKPSSALAYRIKAEAKKLMKAMED